MFYTLQADRETYRQTWPCVLGAQRRFLQLQNTHYSNPNLNHLEILFSYCCCYGCDGSHDPTTHPAADTGTARQTDTQVRGESNPFVCDECILVVLFSAVVFFYDPATPETPCSSRPPLLTFCFASLAPLYTQHRAKHRRALFFFNYTNYILLNLALLVSPVVFSPNFVKCPCCFCCCSLCTVRVCFMTFRGCRFNALVSRMSRSS